MIGDGSIVKEADTSDLKPKSFGYDVLEFIMIAAYVALPLSISLGLFMLLGDYRTSGSWGIRLLAGLVSALPTAFVRNAFRMARRHAARLVTKADRAAQS